MTNETKKFTIAGTAADGNGALTGWNGLGTITRAELVTAAQRAKIPAAYLPRSKSTKHYAGNAVRSLNYEGYIARAANPARKRTDPVTGKPVRAYRARWTVLDQEAGQRDVGETAGRVVAAFELLDNDETLYGTGDADVVRRVVSHYERSRDAEVYRAGDVTSWIQRVLVDHFNATRYAMGYYIPAGQVDGARAFVASMAATGWGRNWANPPLPVATSDELRAGIASGFGAEVDGVARSLQTARESARKEGKTDVAPATAARLLRDLSDVDGRADAYRVLCGGDVIAPVAARLAALVAELQELSDDASQRFALLDLSDGPSYATPEPTDRLSPVERRAESDDAARQASDDAENHREAYRKARTKAMANGCLNSAEFRAAVERVKAGDLPEDWAIAAHTVAHAYRNTGAAPR